MPKSLARWAAFLGVVVTLLLTTRTAAAATLTVTSDFGNPANSAVGDAVTFTFTSDTAGTGYIELQSGSTSGDCTAGPAANSQPLNFTGPGSTQTISFTGTSARTSTITGCFGAVPASVKAAIVWTVVAATYAMSSDHGNPIAANVGENVKVTLTTNRRGLVNFWDGACLTGGFLGQSTISGGAVSFTTSYATAGAITVSACPVGGFTGGSISGTIAKGATTTTVAGAPGPLSSVYGTGVVLTANVASAATVNGGAVTFTATNGAAPSSTYTCTVAAGTCSMNSITDLGVGSHTISASYGGDTSHLASSSTTSLVRNVTKTTSTVTAVSSSQNPQVPANGVTFSATVTAPGTPTGTVVFKDGATTLTCGTLPDPITTSPQTVSCLVTGLSVGDHPITAVYSGDANVDTSTGTLDTSGVPTLSPPLPAGNQRITTSASSIAVTPTPATGLVYGDTVDVAIAVTSASGTPTGMVTVTASGLTYGPVPLVAGALTVSSSMFPGARFPAGTYDITVSYAGDGTFSPSTGAVNVTVAKATTSTTVDASPATSVFGQPLQITATVTSLAPNASIAGAGGTIEIFDGPTSLGSSVIDAAGTASVTTATLATGDHSFTAVYSGDPNYATSAATPLARPVDKASVTTVLVASANPIVIGGVVTFTATVTAAAPGAGTPTGVVVFYSGNDVLGTSVLVGSTASYTNGTLPAGSSAITAVYGGDDDFATKTSAVLNEVVSQNATPMTLAVTQSSSQYLSLVTLTATLTGGATGTVTFSDDVTPLGTATVGADGNAKVTTSTLSVGAHAVTASYAGDASHGAATASAAFTISARTTSTTLTQSSESSKPGEGVIFTAAVATDLGPVSVGHVTFFSGTTALGAAVDVSASGLATLTTTALTTGTASITARYESAATDGFAASTSAVLSHEVAAPPAPPAPPPAATTAPTVTPTAAPAEDAGCGCSTAGAPASGTTVVGISALALAALGAAVARRRRRVRR